MSGVVHGLRERVRRADPEGWAGLQQMLAATRRWSARADELADIPEGLWAELPVDLVNRLTVPAEYDGLPLTATAVRRAVVFELLGRADPGLALALPGPGLAMPAVVVAGTPSQRKQFFDRFLGRGRPVWAAFAITEPQGGSAATSLRTVARPDGEGYRIDGEKCFITNGARADIVITFATTDPARGPFAIRGFAVEAGTPGFGVGRCEDMMGLRASQLATLTWTDCTVPADCLLGDPRGVRSSGFAAAQGAWELMRPALSALIVGACLGALDHARCALDDEGARGGRAAASARERLATEAARVHAARLLALRAAWSYDEGRRGPLDGSLAKASAASAAAHLAAALTDLLPERAALLTDPLGRFCRDSHAFDILEGTGDMHRLMVARRFATEVTSGVRRGA